MSKSIRADWAALVPWAGIQGKPPFLDGPDGNIQISDVEGLAAALASAQNPTLARVAYTGQYYDLLGKPVFGSAAFANVDDFLLAQTAKTFQTGTVTFVAGTQSYTATFTETMNALPKVRVQVMMADTNGELFSAIIQEDTITTSGFDFWLTGVPSISTGKARFWAVVEDTP